MGSSPPLVARACGPKQRDNGGDPIEVQQPHRARLKRDKACVHCRLKKYKRSGERDGCSKCIKGKIPLKCVYQMMAKPISRKPRLQAKLQELKKQIVEQEAKLIELEEESARQGFMFSLLSPMQRASRPPSGSTLSTPPIVITRSRNGTERVRGLTPNP